MVGRPLPGNRNDCKAWEESGAKAAVGRTTTIADGGCPGTGLVMPRRRRKGEDPPDWKEAHNTSHKQVRARVEHVFACMGTSGAGAVSVPGRRLLPRIIIVLQQMWIRDLREVLGSTVYDTP
ncbi:hypothetical protein Sxan_04510 [Streptomyces xanthophaeus]|uniref:Transposase n=1 Tax=Streptomyces xanthophaeus TaxID=67385 RepID=A0A919LD87_9ACTN|nr:hypothetical protein Sxan_04510 [Streptomyces xanthophaeus]